MRTFGLHRWVEQRDTILKGISSAASCYSNRWEWRQGVDWMIYSFCGTTAATKLKFMSSSWYRGSGRKSYSKLRSPSVNFASPSHRTDTSLKSANILFASVKSEIQVCENLSHETPKKTPGNIYCCAVFQGNLCRVTIGWQFVSHDYFKTTCIVLLLVQDKSQETLNSVTHIASV